MAKTTFTESLVRPGGAPLFDPKDVAGGLLKGKSRNLALNSLPELQGRFQDLADLIPSRRLGAGQGVNVIIDPNRAQLESTISPYIGAFDSPEFQQRVSEAYKKLPPLESATTSMVRHATERQRIASSVHSMIGRVPAEDLGYVIRMGLQQPNVATSEATVRDAHIFLSYLFSGVIPPGTADMDMRAGKGANATARHAVNLALNKEFVERSPYPLGMSKRAHQRNLNLMQGIGEGGGVSMLASMGLQTPRSAPPHINFEEQMLTSAKPPTQFEAELRNALAQNLQRVGRSEKLANYAVSNPENMPKFAIIWKDAAASLLDNIFNGTSPGGPGQVPGMVVRPTPNVSPGFIQKVIDTAFEGELPEGMQPFGKEHIARAKNNIKRIIQRWLDLPKKDTAKALEVADRLKYFEKDLKHGLEEALRGNTIVPKVRTASAVSEAVMGGQKATKTLGAIPRRELNLAALDKEIESAFLNMGRMPTKVPMFLVAALAAGMTAVGLARTGDSA
jgi:hypothetical protein